jgi:PRTRC genetic system protein C
MKSRPLSRHFEFNGVRLPDIDEKLSPEEIRTLYSHQYPDIATASLARNHTSSQPVKTRTSMERAR